MGSTDSVKATANTRETREEYNRAAGRVAKRTTKAKAEVAKPAAPAEIVAGSQLSDSKGEPIGTVESVDAQGAIVASGKTRIRVPLESFGKNSQGLLLGITKAEFEAAVAKATAQPQG